jgi:hypothetical protein
LLTNWRTVPYRRRSSYGRLRPLTTEGKGTLKVKNLSTAIAMIALLWAGTAAAGPIDTPVPANPCPMPIDDFKLALVANEIGTDLNGMACGSGGSCAETSIVCTNVGDTDDGAIDVGVELFSSSGLPVPGMFASGNSVKCGLAPGATVAFVTAGMEFPWIGQQIAAGPVVPLGSLRIVTNAPKIVACDVTLVDRTNVNDTGNSTSIKDVTVTRASKPQKGD